MNRNISMAELNALTPGETLSAYTEDVRTPERFLKLAKGAIMECAGNLGSVQVVTGSVYVAFETGVFSVLREYGDTFHCRTPHGHSIEALEDSIIQVLGEHRVLDHTALATRTMQATGARMVWTGMEAYYALGDMFAIGHPEMELLRREVLTAPRKRVRLCTHANMKARLHEMFVCYTPGAKIAPHKHLAKDESFHVLEGALDFITYNETGDVTEITSMGDRHSGLPFYVRVPMDTNHAVNVTSEFCILHEGTAGPFDRAHTVWAQWGR